MAAAPEQATPEEVPKTGPIAISNGIVLLMKDLVEGVVGRIHALENRAEREEVSEDRISELAVEAADERIEANDEEFVKSGYVWDEISESVYEVVNDYDHSDNINYAVENYLENQLADAIRGELPDVEELVANALDGDEFGNKVRSVIAEMAGGISEQAVETIQASNVREVERFRAERDAHDRRITELNTLVESLRDDLRNGGRLAETQDETPLEERKHPFVFVNEGTDYVQYMNPERVSYAWLLSLGACDTGSYRALWNANRDIDSVALEMTGRECLPESFAEFRTSHTNDTNQEALEKYAVEVTYERCLKTFQGVERDGRGDDDGQYGELSGDMLTWLSYLNYAGNNVPGSERDVYHSASRLFALVRNTTVTAEQGAMLLWNVIVNHPECFKERFLKEEAIKERERRERQGVAQAS